MKRLTSTIEDLKDAVPIRTLIEHLGGVVTNGWGGDRCDVRCPFHDDRDSSAYLFEGSGYFKCEACGAPRDGMAGDIIDVAKAAAEHGLADFDSASITEAIAWLRREVA
jgi:hypothetical protein